MPDSSLSDESACEAPGGCRLLLCDDSAGERRALAQFLRQRGFAVQEAGDGAAALHSLKNSRVDLLLLDLNMPVADGFDVLGYLQEHRRALPVVLMSGMPPDQIQQRMHVLPQRELPPLMIKPVDPDSLLAVIELQLAGQLPR
jgi:DNA-binding response OmpR family regulator